jgi:hypothetical protein
MNRRHLRFAAIAGAALVLSGCTSGGPVVIPTLSGSAPASNSGGNSANNSEPSSVDGEWVLTRTVTRSDDTNNPAHAVGAVSVRDVLFSDVHCAPGSCAGTIESGPTTAVRDKAKFTSDGNVFSYDFSGFVSCLSPADGTVLVANGFQYRSHVELTVADPGSTGSAATNLEGTLSYTDSITNDALSAGCARDPVSSTTEYELVAVRAAKK